MEASDTATELSDQQKSQISELDQLKSDGVITQEQYDNARAKVEAGEPLRDPNAPPHNWGNAGTNLPPGPTPEEIAAANAAQAAPATDVPEVRPQAFQGGADRLAVSDASRRLDANNEGPTEEQIAAANSDENKKAAIEASQMPNLEVGQRVVLTGDHSEAGRMAHVTRVIYEDGIQELLSLVGSPARRFAKVLQYVVVTRDGRSDTLTATTDQLKPIEENQGWGRGQI